MDRSSADVIRSLTEAVECIRQNKVLSRIQQSEDVDPSLRELIEAVEQLNDDRAILEPERPESLFRIAFDHNEDGILLVDARTRQLYLANDTFCRMTGYGKDEIDLLTVADIHPGDRIKEIEEKFSKQMRGESGVVSDVPVCRKDGSQFVADINVGSISHNGRMYFLGTFRDVSERRRLEDELHSAQRMEAVGRLAGGVAHDFNNILTAIISFSGFVLDEFREDDPARADVQEILDAANRATSLTRQLLAFSRRQTIKPTALNLNRVVKDLEKMLGRLIGEDIHLEIRLREDLSVIRADKTQMEQILLNLAVNAKDAMPQGGALVIETFQLRLDSSYFEEKGFELPAGQYVMLAVTDTGEGMDEETKHHVFEPFFTTKSEGKGTGLGLSTVYGIVQQNHGCIWIQSAPGRGTKVQIFLPSDDSLAVADVVQMASMPPAQVNETIIVVEDDDSARKAAKRILDKAGYHVLEAISGDAALVGIEHHDGPIHLMLTDVVMPGINGKELADRLASIRPGIKVLFMSGYTAGAINTQGVLDDDVSLLEKPFTRDSLLQKVRMILADQEE